MSSNNVVNDQNANLNNVKTNKLISTEDKMVKIILN